MGFQDDKLILSYFKDADTLSLWNGRPASEGGDLIATGALIPSNGEDNAVTVDIIADYDADGRVVGFTIEHATELLLHPLLRGGNHFEASGMYAGYGYTLALNNGTLTIKSDRKQARSDEVAEHLTAHYDAAGDAAGFTLEYAVKLLLPLLEGALDKELVGVNTNGWDKTR